MSSQPEPSDPQRNPILSHTAWAGFFGASAIVAGTALWGSGLSSQWLQDLHAIARARPAMPDAVWASLTLFGFGWPLLIIGLALGWGRGACVGALLRVALGCAVLSPLLKLVFGAARPGATIDTDNLAFIGEPVIQTGSMPSGHAMAVYAVALVLVASRASAASRIDQAWWVGGALAAAAVAWSRVAVGAHWPADVFVGAGLGIWVGCWGLWAERHWAWGPWLDGTWGRAWQVILLATCSIAWGLTRTGLPEVHVLQWGLAGVGLGLAGRRAWRLLCQIDLEALWRAVDEASHAAKDWATRHPRLSVSVGWVVGGLLLAVLLHHQPLDFVRLAEQVQQVSVGAWVLGLAGWLAAYGVRAHRLQREWRHRSWQPWWACLRVVLQHNAAVLLVPLRLGEAGYLALSRRLWGASLGEAAASLVRWRVQDACVLASAAALLAGPVTAALMVVTWLVGARIMRRVGQTRSRSAVVVWWPAEGWGMACLQWSLRIASLGWMLHGLLPGEVGLPGWSPWAAALGAELGAMWPLQGPAGFGPFEAGAWAAARLQVHQLPAGFMAAVLAAHATCTLAALVAAACATWPGRADPAAPPLHVGREGAPPHSGNSRKGSAGHV